MAYNSRESKISDIATRIFNTIGTGLGEKAKEKAAVLSRRFFDAHEDDPEGWSAFNSFVAGLEVSKDNDNRFTGSNALELIRAKGASTEVSDAELGLA